MKCIVCKINKEKGEGRRRWVFSSERVPIARIQVLFKLYDLTKKEFPAGSVCPICFDLVAQIDSLECQMMEVQKTLRARVNCCATEEDYMAAHANDDDDFYIDDREGEDDEVEEEDVEEEEGESTPAQAFRKVAATKELVKRQAKKRPTRESYLRTRVKREKPDYVEYEGHHVNSVNDDEDDSVERGDSPQLDMSRYLSVEHIKKEKDDSEVKPQGSASIEKKSFLHEPNRSAENLDFNLTVTRTTRGHDQLVYESYTYLKTTHQPTGDIARWKCTSYYATKTGCRAKLHTTMDGLCVLLDSKTEHNHPPPDERQLKIILFREQVKQIANNHPEMKPTEILTNAQMLLDTPTALGLKDESIMRYIQRIKSKNRLERQQQLQLEQGLKPEEHVGHVVDEARGESLQRV